MKSKKESNKQESAQEPEMSRKQFLEVVGASMGLAAEEIAELKPPKKAGLI